MSGVNQTHYVMLGNRYEYDDFYARVKARVATNPRDAEKDLDRWRDEVEDRHRDCHYEEIANLDGVTIVSDGMNGEYVCVGYVIAKSDSVLGEFGDITAPVPSNWDDVGDWISKILGFAEPVEIIIFTHYS